MGAKMTEERKTLADWAEEYYVKNKVILNLGTLRKRRAVANVGLMVPPKTYLLTQGEWQTVLKTPLPMCKKVVNA